MVQTAEKVLEVQQVGKVEGSPDPVLGSYQAHGSATGSRGDPAGDLSPKVVLEVDERSN